MTFQGYQKYKDSGIEWFGKIPEHWKTRKLRMFAKIQPSNVDKKSVEDQETIHLCNYMDVYYREYINENINFMKATANRDQIRKFTLRKGDTIITKDSETPLDIAVPAYVPNDLPGILCGYHLAIIRPLDKIAVGEFIFRAFQSESISNQYSSFANGLTRYGLKVYSIGNAIFPLPPLNEQKSIIYFLKKKTFEIDALITDKAKVIEILQEYRQVIICEAITKGLDPNVEMKDSGIEWIGEIPEYWTSMQLRRLCIFVGGTSFPYEFQGVEDAKYPFYKVEDMNSPLNEKYMQTHQNSISEESMVKLNAKVCDNGTIIFPKVGAALLTNKRRILTTKSIFDNNIIGLKFNKKCDINFFYYLLCLLDLSIFSNPGAVPSINTKQLKSINVIYPPQKKQIEISKMLDKKISEINSLIKYIKRQIEGLSNYHQSLISEAVTGKIDIRNYNLNKN